MSAAIVGSLLTTFAAPTTLAQTNPTRVPDRPACSTCTIVFADTVSIGKTSDPILLDFSTGIAITSQHILATGKGDSPTAVYDKRGGFVSGFGRLGSGPGEFPRPNPPIFRAPADSLFVGGIRDVMVFSPARTYVRSFNIPGAYHFVVLGNGRIVVSGHLFRDTSQTMFPVHLLTPSGDLERSFGSITKFSTRCAWCDLYGVAPGANNSVWSHAPQRQELTRWDLNGRLLEHIVLTDSPWFREWNPEVPGRYTRVMDMSYDNDAGILWIRSALPIDSARVPVGAAFFATGNAQGMVAAGSMDPFADAASVLEAYDVNRREIIASARYDRQDIRMLPGGMAASSRQDSDGYVRFMIAKLVVRGR